MVPEVPARVSEASVICDTLDDILLRRVHRSVIRIFEVSELLGLFVSKRRCSFQSGDRRPHFREDQDVFSRRHFGNERLQTLL